MHTQASFFHQLAWYRAIFNQFANEKRQFCRKWELFLTKLDFLWKDYQRGQEQISKFGRIYRGGGGIQPVSPNKR